METTFEIAACHGDHAGKAYITIKHIPTGTVIAVQHLPFPHDPAETLEQQQHRIVTESARLTKDATAFLSAQTVADPNWPAAEHGCGAAPQENEPPNAFGQPVGQA